MAYFLSPEQKFKDAPSYNGETWIISPESEKLAALLKNFGFSPKMVQEYKDIHSNLGSMSNLVFDPRMGKSKKERRHIEGRGVELPFEAVTKIAESVYIGPPWSMYIK